MARMKFTGRRKLLIENRSIQVSAFYSAYAFGQTVTLTLNEDRKDDPDRETEVKSYQIEMALLESTILAVSLCRVMASQLEKGELPKKPGDALRAFADIMDKEGEDWKAAAERLGVQFPA